MTLKNWDFACVVCTHVHVHVHVASINWGSLEWLHGWYCNPKWWLANCIDYLNECTWVQNPHRYMHAWLMSLYSMAHCVCLFNIRNTTYPTTEHVYGTIHVPLESVHDLAIGGRHQAISLYKLKASVTTTYMYYWIMHLGATTCLPLPFSKWGLQWTDGRTDKNRQTIAVTPPLTLCGDS